MPADKDWTTPEARRELAAMHAEATPPPWSPSLAGFVTVDGIGGDAVLGHIVAEVSCGHERERENQAIIAAARNAVPQLLKRIERDAAWMRDVATILNDLAGHLSAAAGADGRRALAILSDLRAAGFAPEGE